MCVPGYLGMSYGRAGDDGNSLNTNLPGNVGVTLHIHHTREPITSRARKTLSYMVIV